MERSITQAAKYLAELGYVIVDGDEHWLHARHPHKLSISVRLLEEGYLITRWIHVTPEAQADRRSVLESINGHSADALVSRYYVDADGEFAAEAFFPGPFGKTTFGQFMALWDEDFDAVPESSVDRYLI
jgi:hypothetical protein